MIPEKDDDWKGWQKAIQDYQKIKQNKLLRTFSPNKGKNMNVTPNTTVDTPVDVVQNFYIDAEGNRVEIPFDDGRTYDGSDGEAAQQETAFIAEDGADHAVTVH